MNLGKHDVDDLSTKVKLQNWCASEFPYCCTGDITIQEDGSATCECGASTVPPKEITK